MSSQPPSPTPADSPTASLKSANAAKYPVDARRARSAERYPTRNNWARTELSRRLRKIVGRFVDPMMRSRRSQLNALPVPEDHILFLGDSITDYGMWHEWFPDLPTLNRGVGGETTGELLARIDTAINRPVAVFLLIGTNDISWAVPSAEIIDNLRQIIARIHSLAPGTPIVVESIMPRNVRFREDVMHINRLYRDVVAGAGDHVTYLDLWPALATQYGTLRPDFTDDNLHLNGKGYHAWVETLEPVIESLGGSK